MATIFVSSFRRKSTRLFGLALAFCWTAGAAPESDLLDDDFELHLWNSSAELRSGFGYKDNVLLRHTKPQGSAFWNSGAELMVFRLPADGWHFHLFADFADARYLESTGVDDEQSAVAAMQVAKELGGGWKATFGMNYLYQNQVFDFSGTYTNQASVGQIRGHTISPRWAVRRAGSQGWIELEAVATRQWLAEPLDDFWQAGPRAAAGIECGADSELVLSYQFSRLEYDSRPTLSRGGEALTNTSLSLNSHAVELSFSRDWDEHRRWQTVTVFGYEASLDNGAGFFDYDQYRFSQNVRLRNQQWEITARARIGALLYATQTVSGSGSAHRRKTVLGMTLHAERKFGAHLKAYAGYVWERSVSNLDFDDYSASTLMGGLALSY